MTIRTAREVDAQALLDGVELVKLPPKKGKRETDERTLNLITAFDIETTNIPSIRHAVMYIWQWYFASSSIVVVGRTWEDFLYFVNALNSAIPDGVRLLCFVHHLSFEYHFIRGVWRFSEGDVFATDVRRIVKARLGKVEMRCSYILTNKSLDTLCRDYGVEHMKLSGDDFNYSKMRFSDTRLTKKEMEYCINDVVGLCEAMEKQLERHGDTLETLPVTQTGYCRRLVKKAMRPLKMNVVKTAIPPLEVFQFLRMAFRGGNTHAYRAYAGVPMENVHSYDRASSYPDVLCNYRYPMGAWKVLHESELTLARITEYIAKRGKALILHIKMWNVEIKGWSVTIPYLARYKCQNIHGGTWDNGRVLSAEYLETYVTDIDLAIILEQYDCDIEITAGYSSTYGYLPTAFRDVVKSLYLNKTALKGVPGAEDEYARSKEIINSTYGLMAQSPIKRDILLSEDDNTLYEDEEKTDAEIYAKTISRASLSYAWGVWCTAHARLQLQRAINLIEQSDAVMLYTDTDSVKFCGDVDFTALNTSLEKLSLKNGATAKDRKGVNHPMGVWEHDGTYKRFCTIGAKKYCYEDESGLHITIAGVNKRKGAKELERKGGLDAFAAAAYSNIIFTEAGGTESVYNDAPDIIEWKGHAITPNIYIGDSTYTLGVDADYARFVQGFDVSETARIYREMHGVDFFKKGLDNK